MTLPPHSFRSTRGEAAVLRFPAAHLHAARHATFANPSSSPPPPSGGSRKYERRERGRDGEDRPRLIPPLETFSPILTHHRLPSPSSRREAFFFFGLGLARERGLPCCPVPRGVCFVLCRAVKAKRRAGRKASGARRPLPLPPVACSRPQETAAAGQHHACFPFRSSPATASSARQGSPAGFVPVRGRVWIPLRGTEASAFCAGARCFFGRLLGPALSRDRLRAW